MAETKRIIIEGYSKKPAAKGGYRYAVLANGVWYSTFDENLFEPVGGWPGIAGCKQSGDPVEIEYEITPKGYHNLTGPVCFPGRMRTDPVELGRQVNDAIRTEQPPPRDPAEKFLAESPEWAGFGPPRAVTRDVPPTMQACMGEAFRLVRLIETLDQNSQAAAEMAVHIACAMHRDGRL